MNIYKVNLIVNKYRHYQLFLQFQAVCFCVFFVCIYFVFFLDYFIVFLRFLNRN